MPRFFISYVYEDRHFKSQLVDWANSGLLGSWSAIAESEDLRPRGRKAIRAHLSPLIQSSSCLVLLVGDNSHNHEWLDYEVQTARSAGLPVVSVRLPNTFGGGPATTSAAPVEFSAPDVRQALQHSRG